MRAAGISLAAPLLGLPTAQAALPKAATGASDLAALASQTDAFESSTIEDAIKNLHGAIKPTQSDNITLDVPIFAESAAMVPVTVSTTIPGAQSIYLMVLNNPTPLSISFDLLPGALPYVSTRLWLSNHSDVIAYVRAGNKLYFTKADVRLQGIDGCITHKLGG